ncbi:MAG: Gfo/Idh/MocA family oxidoreductase [Chthonomonadales bacterium]|nr:Gfo/Idh/MocA family oxidoreductase [Chthonomonadales bacterium]
MSAPNDAPAGNGVTRRHFLRSSAAAAVSAALLSTGNYAFAQGSDRIRVGLIGCGGRGTGAAGDCANSAPNIEIWAMGDVFEDRLNGSREHLKGLGDKLKVTDERCFTGIDAYKHVLAQDIQLVILATPPGFRPVHFQAAIEAGKHVFMEKPVATDAPGIRAVLAAGDLATQKGLAVVAGTQRRHQNGYVATMRRIHDGAIGDLVGAQVYWNGGGVGNGTGEFTENDATLEWQIRHWYYLTWLCGDHIVEQHVHNIDVANWAFGAHPVSAMGVGGRAQRTAPVYGQIFDHFAIDFEYPNGVRVMSMCRHWDNTPSNVSERVVGTRGVSDCSSNIWGATPWRYQGQGNNPYVTEHTDLVNSIRAGKPLNEARAVAESTLSAIMGRMAAYTGQVVTWDEALNSKESLMPAVDDLKRVLGVPPVAVPGKTQLT